MKKTFVVPIASHWFVLVLLLMTLLPVAIDLIKFLALIIYGKLKRDEQVAINKIKAISPLINRICKHLKIFIVCGTIIAFFIMTIYNWVNIKVIAFS